jgi:hypothetical protein
MEPKKAQSLLQQQPRTHADGGVASSEYVVAMLVVVF